MASLALELMLGKSERQSHDSSCVISGMVHTDTQSSAQCYDRRPQPAVTFPAFTPGPEYISRLGSTDNLVEIVMQHHATGHGILEVVTI